MVLVNHRIYQGTCAGDDGEYQNKESDVRELCAVIALADLASAFS